MIPRRKPRAPSPQVFIHVASPTIPQAWKQWLPDATHDVTASAGEVAPSTITAEAA
jgi:hypothetical protein